MLTREKMNDLLRACSLCLFTALLIRFLLASPWDSFSGEKCGQEAAARITFGYASRFGQRLLVRCTVIGLFCLVPGEAKLAHFLYLGRCLALEMMIRLLPAGVTNECGVQSLELSQIVVFYQLSFCFTPSPSPHPPVLAGLPCLPFLILLFLFLQVRLLKPFSFVLFLICPLSLSLSRSLHTLLTPVFLLHSSMLHLPHPPPTHLLSPNKPLPLLTNPSPLLTKPFPHTPPLQPSPILPTNKTRPRPRSTNCSNAIRFELDVSESAFPLTTPVVVDSTFSETRDESKLPRSLSTTALLFFIT